MPSALALVQVEEVQEEGIRGVGRSAFFSARGVVLPWPSSLRLVLPLVVMLGMEPAVVQPAPTSPVAPQSAARQSSAPPEAAYNTGASKLQEIREPKSPMCGICTLDSRFLRVALSAVATKKRSRDQRVR